MLAARDAGLNLHAYSQANAEFVSRLGADPAGLLARTLCACSGRLPTQEGGLLKYSQVPGDVAAAVLDVLYSTEVPDESS